MKDVISEIDSKTRLIYLVIDGLGDLPVEELGDKTPLEAANTPNLDFLAKNGKNGLMYSVREGMAPESDVAVISILGYDPFKHYTGRGPLEALGAGVAMKNGDLSLRCNFATVNEQDRILDRRAGRNLTVKEAEELSEAMNDGVKLESHPVDFEFRNTIGHRGVLVFRSREGFLSSRITNTDPAYSRVEGFGVAESVFDMVLKECKPLDENEATRISSALVNEFTKKSHRILEEHEINKKREAQGKLKANIILMRDAGHRLPQFFSINEKYGVRFACLADMLMERGIAKLARMDVVDLPLPSKDIKKDCVLRVNKLLAIFPSYDCFYLHVKGPDEPAHDGNAGLKAEIISKIDEYLIGKLLQNLELEKNIICVTADHSTPCSLKAHSDDPVPLLIAGNGIDGDALSGFSEKECRKGSLGLLTRGTELMPKIMALLKEEKQNLSCFPSV
jgi:2,3-bisphosphoglycerate-independent phosphoglycerate mutase